MDKLHEDYFDDFNNDFCNENLPMYNEVLIFPDTLPLNEQIKLKRIHDGLSQKQLARILNISVTTLSLIEKDKIVISSKCLKRIESYLYAEYYCNGTLIERMDEL